VRPEHLILPETRAICDALHLDPLGLLASGCLIAAVAQEDELPAVRGLRAAGVTVTTCGELLPAGSKLSVVVNNRELPLQTFRRDELARFLDG